MSFGERGTLAPLPEGHRRGLIVLTSFSFLSFISTSSLWLFITYKLLLGRVKDRWSRRKAQRAREKEQQRLKTTQDTTYDIDLSVGLGEEQFREGQTRDISTILKEMDRLAREAAETAASASQPAPEPRPEVDEEEPSIRFFSAERLSEKVNPFPILVYNLLLADMIEALAYALSIKWVALDGIFAPSSTCWLQGWLGSTSNLAASSFLSAISVNSFLTIVLGYRLPRWGLYACVVSVWAFIFLVNAAGVLLAEGTDYQADSGESYFMRANVWCWISSEYNSWRLWSHYFWIIISAVLSISLYIVIFVVLSRQKRNCRHLPKRKFYTPYLARRESEAPVPSGYHPAFLVYPCVYLICITPLVIGRIALIMDKDLGIPYFAFAGSILAGNGLFNSILWTTTIVLGDPDDMRKTGLDRFSFVRTPSREYGHTVIISGPSSRGYKGTDGNTERKDWWWWKQGGLSYARAHAKAHERLNPDLVLVPTIPPVEGPYIKMDVVTRVIVEHSEDKA